MNTRKPQLRTVDSQGPVTTKRKYLGVEARGKVGGEKKQGIGGEKRQGIGGEKIGRNCELHAERGTYDSEAESAHKVADNAHEVSSIATALYFRF